MRGDWMHTPDNVKQEAIAARRRSIITDFVRETMSARPPLELAINGQPYAETYVRQTWEWAALMVDTGAELGFIDFSEGLDQEPHEASSSSR